MTMDKSKRIYIASDHNGNAARAYIIKMLEKDYEVIDLGPTSIQGKVDYTDFAQKLCRNMRNDQGSTNEGSRGILICGTGSGMLIAANRYAHIRAILATDRATASLGREHNDSNVLVLGQWRTPLGAMDEIVKAWLETPFGEERHIARIKKLEMMGGI